MKKLLSIAMAAALSVSMVGCTSSKDAVATVDGKAISMTKYEEQLKFSKWIFTLQQGDNVWDEMKKQNPNYQDTVKSNVLDSMIQLQELLNYAEKNNIKPDEKTLKEYTEQNKKILENAESKKSLKEAGLDSKYLDEYAKDMSTVMAVQTYLQKKAAPTEKQMKEYYNNVKDLADASHILISTTDSNTGKELTGKKLEEAKKKADEVYNKAKSGEDFKTLAKKYSDDKGSAENGGELGEFGKGQMVEEFEKAVFSMKVGEISKPVKTQYGYHIIKLNKKSAQKYDDLKEQIKQTLTQQNVSKLMSDIQSASKVEKNEENLKKVPFGDTGKKEDKKDTSSKDSKDKEKSSADQKNSNSNKDSSEKTSDK